MSNKFYKNEEVSKGDKIGKVIKISEQAVHVKYEDGFFEKFHFKPTHHKQTPISELKKVNEKMNTCCSIPNFEPSKCSDNRINSIEIKFQDGKMYENGVYIGDVEQDEKGLFVVRKSKNKYLNGQKIRIIVDTKFGK